MLLGVFCVLLRALARKKIGFFFGAGMSKTGNSRSVVDVDDRLALEDVEDGVEAREFGGRNGDLAKVEAGCQVRGEQLGRERLDELYQLLGALAAVR